MYMYIKYAPIHLSEPPLDGATLPALLLPNKVYSMLQKHACMCMCVYIYIYIYIYIYVCMYV